jgi:filamentous hemagglutinin
MAIGAGLTMGSGAIASSARMATIAGRGVSLTTRLETNAASRLARLEATSPKAHFFSRHGAATTIEQQYVRATTGLTPDGVMLRPVDSSRFLTHRAQLAAVERAQARFALTGERSFSFEMSEIIGEGFIRGGGSWVQTTNVHAVFKNGRLHTLYPFLSPLP